MRACKDCWSQATDRKLTDMTACIINFNFKESISHLSKVEMFLNSETLFKFYLRVLNSLYMSFISDHMMEINIKCYLDISCYRKLPY